MACTKFCISSLGNSPTHCMKLSFLYRPTAVHNFPFHLFSPLLLTTKLQPRSEGMSSAWVCVDNRILGIMRDTLSIHWLLFPLSAFLLPYWLLGIPSPPEGDLSARTCGGRRANCFLHHHKKGAVGLHEELLQNRSLLPAGRVYISRHRTAATCSSRWDEVGMLLSLLTHLSFLQLEITE